jgi:CHAD domain-containing protein
MKAREVSGLDPSMALKQAAERIVAARAAELYAFVPAALDERNTVVLHDMRIAAKRLRYVLELVGFCLTDVAVEAEARARELQTVIGDIHDCDVLIGRIEHRADAGAKGMRRLERTLSTRRATLFVQFTTLWAAVEASDLRGRIIAATSSSPNGALRSA